MTEAGDERMGGEALEATPAPARSSRSRPAAGPVEAPARGSASNVAGATSVANAGSAGSATGAPSVVDEVAPAALERARRIADETRHALLSAAVLRGPACDAQVLNNALMDAFREHASVDAFSLLFELNVRPFSLVAARIMRMTGCKADPNDVLQEAFLAIYRYPTRFRADKPNAFRNWSYSIIRNTVYRNLMQNPRECVAADALADVLADERAVAPSQASEDRDDELRCQRIYGLLLMLYAHAYEHELKERDRWALDLVEVQGLGYREATDLLGIRLENFKMVVCRARKKIFQAIVRTLGSRLP